MEELEFKKGFQLLNRREKPIDIRRLEEEYNFKLPTLYRLFVEAFELGSYYKHDKLLFEGEEKNFMYMDFIRPEVFSADLYPRAIENEFGGIGFEYFRNPKDVFLHMGGSDLWDEEGYIPIGIGSGDGFLLGVHAENYDQIFYENPFLPDNGVIKIADSIFEFVLYLTEYPNYDEVNEIPYNKMYRNWGENFWRLHKEA